MMNPDKLNKIIGIIRNLKEDAMIANSLGGGKIAGTKEAGDNPPVRKGKNYIYGTGFRKNWLQKRNPPQ